MHRFYIASQNITQDTAVILDRKQIHHIRVVLRLKLQDPVELFDDNGNEYSARITEISSRNIALKIKERLSVSTNSVKITIACAIPKKSRMDDIIDKLTQVGVDAIIPLKTDRVIVRLDKHRELIRLERWRKIAQGACQQSQRNTLVEVGRVIDVGELLNSAKDYDLKLLFTLSGKRQALKDILCACRPKGIIVLIGPEGDFSDEEVALAKKAGFVSASLGSSVLRVDTAAVCAASFIRLYYEETRGQDS